MDLRLTVTRTLQGTTSDILVILSNIHSELRGDTSGVKNEDAAQVGANTFLMVVASANHD